MDDVAGSPDARPAVLQLEGISKTYPGVRALRDVTLAFAAGEVHGLVGENGAGKSTLMGVASGAVVPDAGTIVLAGESTAGGDPSWMRERRLAIVHQEPALLPDLTVAENMRLVMPSNARPPLSTQVEWARRWLQPWEEVARIDPSIPAGRLRPDERFVVEIARALATEPDVLILDEPTEHLLEAGVVVLFTQIRRCLADGMAIVYISHRTREVLQICGVVSALRNGELIGTRSVEDLTEDDLVAMIIGRELGARFPAKGRPDPDAPLALRVDDLSGEGFSDVSFSLRRGEVLGLAGVEGQGQREVLRALAGLSRARGSALRGGEPLPLGRPARIADLGVAYLSNDRRREGILTSLSVRENLVTRSLGRISRLGVIQPRAERDLADDAIAEFGIRTPSSRTRIDALSGGNQQKVMLGRVLLPDAPLLLIDEPSQGVDVGARAEIYGLLRRAADDGRAVVILSSDNSELEGLCDRVLVFSRGGIVEELSGDAVEEARITRAAVTASGSRARSEPMSAHGGWRDALRTRALPWLALVVAIGVLGILATLQNPAYASERNFALVLPLLTVLGFAALGQQFALLVGGIDLSIGPLISVVVVTASFVWAPSVDGLGLAVGFLVLLAVAAATALTNWWLITIVRIAPLIATLVTFTALQGVALLIRPTAGGSFHEVVLLPMQRGIGVLPMLLIIAIVVAIGFEVALTRTRPGVLLRAAGSDPAVAAKVGVRVPRVTLAAYLGASLCGLFAGIAFLPISGTGNALVGTGYTLASIAAVVLGGASIFGGRGSFVGALLGAVLIIQINTVVSFLGLTTYWQEFLLGGLVIVGTAFYSTVGSSASRRSA